MVTLGLGTPDGFRPPSWSCASSRGVEEPARAAVVVERSGEGGIRWSPLVQRAVRDTLADEGKGKRDA